MLCKLTQKWIPLPPLLRGYTFRFIISVWKHPLVWLWQIVDINPGNETSSNWLDFANQPFSFFFYFVLAQKYFSRCLIARAGLNPVPRRVWVLSTNGWKCGSKLLGYWNAVRTSQNWIFTQIVHRIIQNSSWPARYFSSQTHSSLLLFSLTFKGSTINFYLVTSNKRYLKLNSYALDSISTVGMQ